MIVIPAAALWYDKLRCHNYGIQEKRHLQMVQLYWVSVSIGVNMFHVSITFTGTLHHTLAFFNMVPRNLHNFTSRNGSIVTIAKNLILCSYDVTDRALFAPIYPIRGVTSAGC